MINDKYIHTDVEDKIYSYWEKNNLFKPTKNKKQFSVVIPPPNVTGSLHMGHALNNSIQDLLVRYHRMNSYETLWQPGTDHAGIATQALVEKKLTTEGIDKNEIGREKFIEKVWEWKEEHGDIILNQLKKLGCSCDWSRNAFTMDENLSKSVLKVFVELHKKGLIYKDKKLVNWDTVLKTAISDLEVDQREVNSKIYYIQYPIEGSSDFITIATTRPETMLGDTAIAVNPKDDRFKHLVGKFVTVPIVKRKIKIIADDYADPEMGTGALKITPAHDFNDYEVGQRNHLEIINIFTEGGKVNDNAPKEYTGLDRFEARKRILKKLKEKEFFVKEENIKNKVPYGDRSNSIIEPFLTEQWFVDAKKLSIKAKDIVNSKKTNFFPANWSKTYFQWMNNIEPWCISRQLWWGHQIPAWYGPDKKIFVAINEDEAKAEAKKIYNKDVNLIRDPDVLDTWFSSGLWPFATLGWPDNKEYVDKFYPTSVLVTGFDIIFFWVARMIMFGMEFLDKEPFKDIYVHALVKDEKGQKMSKSKGNVINPLDLIEKYSADALRFTLLSMASPGTDVKLSEDRVKGYRNFLNKLWNANNFLITNNCDFSKIEKKPSLTININKWIYSELIETKNKIEKNLKDYRFDEAAKNAYQFTWHSYCDWYLELSKTILFSEDEKAKHEVRQVSAYVFKQILILLHPFIPFVTEEIWLNNKFDNSGKDFLMLANWPSGELERDSSTNQVEKIISIVSELRSFKNELSVGPGSFIDISVESVSKKEQSFFTENEVILKKLGRIKNLHNKDLDKPAATLVVSGDLFKVYFDEDVDLELIKKNLITRQNKYQEEMDKTSNRLANKDFVDRAPKDIVDQEKNNYNNLKNDVERISITIKGI
ncbi:valine--tRNA ligase [Candidatus Pelagibacter giovannonii]|uniref:Valine--tRNA ligase n=1 Tax=Candidatus Pelagibacter giovannonii TaxID=2563896 RepID=A0A6H1Q0R7_9PROT|nr:valine--tRNA ligase [Candidatus Pelagibacter giovannonii]QIZ20414.1 valine--tRNA ligase [Candidatus Pelagibacter giovannonii]